MGSYRLPCTAWALTAVVHSMGSYRLSCTAWAFTRCRQDVCGSAGGDARQNTKQEAAPTIIQSDISDVIKLTINMVPARCDLSLFTTLTYPLDCNSPAYDRWSLAGLRTKHGASKEPRNSFPHPTQNTSLNRTSRPAPLPCGYAPTHVCSNTPVDLHI